MFVCRLRTDHLYPEKKQVVEYVEEPKLSNMGVSENVVYPIFPMVLLIIIPTKWL